MTPKELVKAFYDEDLANDETVIKQYFHKQCQLHWNSSNGFSLLKYDDIVAFFEGVRQTYTKLSFSTTHLLSDGNFVTSRHHAYAQTIEQPNEEILLAHFIAIWEVKDDKLYRCYELSQLADDKTLES